MNILISPKASSAVPLLERVIQQRVKERDYLIHRKRAMDAYDVACRDLPPRANPWIVMLNKFYDFGLQIVI